MPDVTHPRFLVSKAGLYRDVPAADYFADCCPEPSFTQSLAKLLLDRSPAHARLAHPRLAPPTEADEPADKYIAAQAIGNAAHKLLIGRGKEIVECKFDNWRTDKAKAVREQAEAAGQTPILAKHFACATKMVEAALLAMPHRAFIDGDGEVVAAWHEDGLWFRTMLDWVEPDLRQCWDYKSTGLSVAPHAIPKLMVDANWDLQAAMQERGLDVLDPANAGRRKFRFVAQENEPPYALTVCELSESVMHMGRKKLAMAIDIWRRCMTTGEWPCYPSEIVFPEYPAWLETRLLEREIAHEERTRKAYPPVVVAPDQLMGG